LKTVSAAVASPPRSGTRNFTRYACGVLGWNLAVVLWGAYVRASGSGAGCGNHWPLCNGEVVPHAPQIQTLIEFTHRGMSGIAFVAVAALLVWSMRVFPRPHRARKMAVASFAFLVVEALLGAGLVLFDYVGADSSVGRALYLSLHLANTLLLVAALSLAAWFSRDSAPAPGRTSRLVAATLPVALLIAISGGIAALGDTLFPATSLAEGFRQDLSTTAHFLLRLRVFHPALAIAGGMFFGAVAVWVMRRRQRRELQRIALAVLILTIGQLCAGAINLVLLAPVWMQILHLLMADLVWISLVLMTVETVESPR
jgi:heme a synthase